MGKPERVPAAIQGKHDEIVALTDGFCQQHLNEEYRELCRRMAATLCQQFGLSPKTGSAKSTAIMDLLKSGQADPNWTLPSRMWDNPMAWLIQVDGLIVDARHAPREIQEEAFRRGMIPYLP